MSTNKKSQLPIDRLLILTVVLLSSSAVDAACKGANCICKPSELQFAAPEFEPDANGLFPMSLEADDMQTEGSNLVILRGNAEVRQGRQTIIADELQYHRDSRRVIATGNVEMISEKGDYIASESVDVISPTQIGTLKNSEFKLARSVSTNAGVDTVKIDSRGSADKVDLLGEGVVALEGARYTMCQEGNSDVVIGASKLELDRNAGVGTARHATLRFLGVPILYLPYVSFPINDERKTGLLTPGFGNDDESGNIISLPWYWNIAKHQDATITPRYFTDRGLQIAGEFRRRTTTSNTFIYGEVLPDDDLYGDDRDMFSIQHFQQFTDNFSGSINYNDVSDIDYFDDLRNDVRLFSASYVPRNVDLRYNHQYFDLRASGKEYQIIDPIVPESSKPYERLPSITFNSRLPQDPDDIRYGLYASYNDFSSDTRIEGSRIAVAPYVSKRWNNLWGFVEPRVSLQHRSYDLTNTSVDQEDSPSFTVPIFSLSAGMFFEKNTNWFGKSVLQTLEPRVFYAYAPDEDQSDIPLFDTAQVSQNNLAGIYRENRFYGEDRVGDTNQITLGVTTRIIDNESGDERLKATIGQQYLLDDQEQNLRAGQIIEKGAGDLLAEIRTTSKAGWSSYGFVQYDHDESELVTGRFDIGYSPRGDRRKRFSVGYYFRERGEVDVDQITVDLKWPISNRWSMSANQRYSIESSESLSTALSLEYNACCWRVRFTGYDRINNRDINDKKQTFFIELELTNLGRLKSGVF